MFIDTKGMPPISTMHTTSALRILLRTQPDSAKHSQSDRTSAKCSAKKRCIISAYKMSQLYAELQLNTKSTVVWWCGALVAMLKKGGQGRTGNEFRQYNSRIPPSLYGQCISAMCFIARFGLAILPNSSNLKSQMLSA